MQSKKSNLRILCTLGALSTVSPFSIDMYLPAFPQIAEALGTTVPQVSLSLSSYFLALSFGQLFYGPLLDRFGRKRPLFAGLILYVLSSLWCGWAHTVEQLIVARFFQAFGGCVAQVGAFAMVRDFFTADQAAKVFSLLMLAVGLSPLFAPTVGGLVTTWFGWQSVFFILAGIVSGIGVFCYLFLPDGYVPNRAVILRLRPTLAGFWQIYREPEFFAHALSGALLFSGLFAYLSGSPRLFMEVYRVDATTYGLIFAGLSVGFIGANQVNIALLRYYSSAQIMRVALISAGVIGTLFFVAGAGGWLGLPSTLVLLFFYLGNIGVTNPNASALALRSFTHNVGSASALLGFTQIGVGAVISAAMGLVDVSGPAMLGLVFMLTAWSGLGVFVYGRRSLGASPAVIYSPSEGSPPSGHF